MEEAKKLRTQADGVLSPAAFIQELADFVISLPKVKGVNPIALVLMGQLTLEGVKEWMKDFWAFGVNATQRIAGQLSRIVDDDKTFRAIAQAFSTEAGCYLTPNHMEIWADFCGEVGIPRHELDGYVPIPETLMCIYTQSYFLIHGTPEEAVATFHLGVPPQVADRVSPGITMGGLGVIRGEGMSLGEMQFNLGALLERVLADRYGIKAQAGSYFFKLHEEIEPFEQGEAWEYIAKWITTRTQQDRFRRAYRLNILAQRAREPGLVRHLSQFLAAQASP